MPPTRPIRDVLAENLISAPCPRTHDALGRPIIGPCMVWKRSTTAGYGQVTNIGAFGDRRPRLVHRVAWALSQGWDLRRVDEVPELDHLCRVRPCAATLHLEPVTRAENIRRGDGNQDVGKDVCDKGHPFDLKNTRVRSDGSRKCRACHRQASREAWRAKHRPDLLGTPALTYAESARSPKR